MSDYDLQQFMNMTEDELYHFGIKGMKWGRRRWQNEDGSFNEAGKKRYDENGLAPGFGQKAGAAAAKVGTAALKGAKTLGRNVGTAALKGAKTASRKIVKGVKKGVSNKMRELKDAKKKELTPEQKAEKRKKILKVGAAIAGTALAVYGAKKFHDVVRDKNVNIRINQGYEAVRRGLEASANTAKRTGNADLLATSARSLFEGNMAKSAVQAGTRQAAKDSFGTALKNVIAEERFKKGWRP